MGEISLSMKEMSNIEEVQKKKYGLEDPLFDAWWSIFAPLKLVCYLIPKGIIYWSLFIVFLISEALTMIYPFLELMNVIVYDYSLTKVMVKSVSYSVTYFMVIIVFSTFWKNFKLRNNNHNAPYPAAFNEILRPVYNPSLEMSN